MLKNHISQYEHGCNRNGNMRRQQNAKLGDVIALSYVGAHLFRPDTVQNFLQYMYANTFKRQLC